MGLLRGYEGQCNIKHLGQSPAGMCAKSVSYHCCYYCCYFWAMLHSPLLYLCHRGTL